MSATSIVLIVCGVMLGLVVLVSTWRMLVGPSDADRTIGADLLFFGIIGLIAVVGVGLGNAFTFDIVLIATVVGFLSAASLGRALSGGRR